MKTIFTLLFFICMAAFPARAAQESAYDRVLRTGVLRCGYFVWQPYFMKDPNTGKFSGMYYDLMDAIGKSLNIKIEWTQEYTLGTQIESLKSGKVDALCGDGPWTRSAMPYLDYSDSMFYFPVHIWVAHDRKNLHADFNSPKTKFTALDGDISEDLVKTLYPQAGLLSIPGTGEPTTLMENVAAGKAQALIEDDLTVGAYNKSRPDAALVAVDAKPLAIYPNVISAAPEDDKLIAMMNRSIRFLQDTGITARILRQYDPSLKTAILPAPHAASSLP